MTTSQNGWPADPDPTKLGIAPCSVAGVSIGDGLLAGPVTVALTYVARQVHLRVETLQPGQCWGYKYRPVTGGAELSNHASGTAVDLNAPRHPLGQAGTFTSAQVEEIHRILAEVDDVVRWGGDYTGRIDEMHFEIVTDPVTLAGVAARLGGVMQLPAILLDYSSGPPSGAAVAAAGVDGVPVRGVIRYLPKEGGSKVKTITVAEYQDMVAHGLAVAFIYEHRDGARASQGFAAGVHDAQWALAQAKAIGVDDPVIYFTVDFDADPASIDAYFQGVNSVLGVGRTAGYGSYRVIEWLFDHSRITYGWQTAAWSHGARSSRAHLYQRIGSITVGGIGCDINDVLKANFGATNETQQETDMTPEQSRMLYNSDRVLTEFLNPDTDGYAKLIKQDIGGGKIQDATLPIGPIIDLKNIQAVLAGQQQALEGLKAQVDAIAAHILGKPV
jgi:hypothetical protein